MERVTGIGGVFLRARDAEALRAWYESNLGIAISEWGGHVFEAVPGTSTVWSIFPGDTGYWLVTRGICAEVGGGSYPGLLARMRNGRVSALVARISVCD